MNISPEQSPPVTFLGDYSKKLATNTFFNLVGRSWSFLVTLLLTPYILRHLDVGEFGVWILLSVFTNSFNLLELGLGSSFVKYISEYYTYENYDRINQVLFSGLVFYGLFGLLLIGIGLALEGPLFNLFHITGAGDVYLLVLVSCAVQNIAMMLLSVFKGIQRMDKSNAIEIKMSIVNVIGTVLLLERGHGLLGLGINMLTCATISVALSWWTVRRSLPKIRLGWNFNAQLLKSMFVYGSKIQVSRFGALVCFGGVDKLIISRYLGIAAVSFYEVGSRLTSFMRSVPLVMISALIPATSELGARKDRQRILQTYYLATKYVAILTVAMASFVILEARSLVLFWVGHEFEASVVLIQILAIGYGVNVMVGAASQTGAGVGHPEFDMKSTALLAILNPILSLILVNRFGAAGAAAGTSIALVSGALYLLFIFHRQYLGTSMWTVVRDLQLRPIAAGALSILAVLGFHQVLPAVTALHNVRYLIPVKVATDFALFAPMYVALLIALRQVTVTDWNNFTGLISFGFEFLRHPARERVKIYR